VLRFKKRSVSIGFHILQEYPEHTNPNLKVLNLCVTCFILFVWSVLFSLLNEYPSLLFLGLFVKICFGI